MSTSAPPQESKTLKYVVLGLIIILAIIFFVQVVDVSLFRPEAAPPAGETDISLRPTSNSVEVGDSFGVAMYVEGAQGLYGFQADLTYDTQIFSYKGYRLQSFFTKGDQSSYFDISPGTANPGTLSNFALTRRRNGAGENLSISGDGNLVIFDFDVVGVGVGAVRITDSKFIDSNLQVLTTNTLDTQIIGTVSGGTGQGGGGPFDILGDYGLTEGDIISSLDYDGDFDVYIVNEYFYKRLFINPTILGMYGHLGFDKVRSVTPEVRDRFITSGTFRNCETDDQRVFGLESTGEDTAMLHHVNISGAQAVAEDPNFFQSVFCMNTNEYNWYTNNDTLFGGPWNSLSQIPDYSRYND